MLRVVREAVLGTQGKAQEREWCYCTHGREQEQSSSLRAKVEGSQNLPCNNNVLMNQDLL